MDIADIAEQQEQLARLSALTQRRRPGPEFTGRCANCGEPVEAPLRWCDADCREDWAKREGR